MEKQDEKKFSGFILLLLSVLITPSGSNATIFDIRDAASLRYFTNTSTGYTWMVVDNFFGMNFNQVETAIAGTGYLIAPLADIQALHASLPQSDFYTWNTVVGCGERPGNDLTWSFYDIGNPTLAGGSWIYSSTILNGG